MADENIEDDDTELFSDRWPEVGDKAFVSAPPVYGACAAEDVRERLWRMVRGYRHAADLLVRETEREAYLRANLIYPIVFSYRHSLELALKQLLEEHGEHVGHKQEFRDHRLERIWPRCREVIEHFNPRSDPTPLDVIANLVAEFADVDPGSYSFRYASDTKGKQMDIKIKYIDLTELQKIMASVHNFLECIDSQISELSTADFL